MLSASILWEEDLQCRRMDRDREKLEKQEVKKSTDVLMPRWQRKK